MAVGQEAVVALAVEEPLVAGKVLDKEQIEQIEQLISKIETRTQGELKVVIASSSSTTSHVPFEVFLISFLLLALIDLPALQATLTGDIWWPLWAWPMISLILTRLLSPRSGVQRFLTPFADRIEQVEVRAQLEFYHQQIGQTEGRTGVLLYISLMEHLAVVLGDEKINRKLAVQDWQLIIDDLIRDTRKSNLYQGLRHAVEDVGELLERHFPIKDGEKKIDEISNGIVFRNF